MKFQLAAFETWKAGSHHQLETFDAGLVFYFLRLPLVLIPNFECKVRQTFSVILFLSFLNFPLRNLKNRIHCLHIKLFQVCDELCCSNFGYDTLKKLDNTFYHKSALVNGK